MKIDIIHATAGEGHRKIAIAIQDAFARLKRQDLQVRLMDSLEYATPIFKATYAPVYNWAVMNAPKVWGFFYELLDNALIYTLLRPFRALTNSFHARKLCSDILRNQPDIVISTHFMPPEILGRAKLHGKLKAKMITVITDYYPHTFWVNPGTDFYWVMAEETKKDLIHRGVPAEKIIAGGIPVNPMFKPIGKKDEFRKKYGLETGRYTILLTAGSFGLGPQEAILEALKAFQDKIQCFVVCARNAELKKRLDKTTYPFPMKVFGFIDFMPELMEASDLMIAKSGGSSTTEALAKGLVMVVMTPIPGQETRNAKLLKACDAAFFLEKPEDIREIVQSILSDPKIMEQKISAVKALARPDASDDLVKTVLEL